MGQITAGIEIQYAPDNSPIGWNPAGVGAKIEDITAPWVTIPDIVEIPEVGGAPDTLESTVLHNTKYKTYIPALLDTGGTVSLKVNDSYAFREAVADLDDALLLGKVWFRINLPEPIYKSMVFSGDTVELGFGGASINGILTNTLNITPDSEPVWLANEVA